MNIINRAVFVRAGARMHARSLPKLYRYRNPALGQFRFLASRSSDANGSRSAMRGENSAFGATGNRSEVWRPQLGLGTPQVDSSIQILRALLDAEFSLYISLRNAHWGVRSPQFRELHLLFKDVYEHVDGVYDEVAERIRTLGGHAVISPENLVTSVPERALMEKENSAPIIVRNIAEALEGVIQQMRGAIRELSDHGDDYGSVDYLTGTLREHEKFAWQIRSHLGK